MCCFLSSSPLRFDPAIPPSSSPWCPPRFLHRGRPCRHWCPSCPRRRRSPPGPGYLISFVVVILAFLVLSSGGLNNLDASDNFKPRHSDGLGLQHGVLNTLCSNYFPDLRKDLGPYLVDKTKLIEKIIKGHRLNRHVDLVLRPRRCGKSTMLQML